MMEIAIRCRASEVLAGPKVIGWAQGEVDRGWQDKSADGCRAHVVGWMTIFVTLGPQQAGPFSEKGNGVNDADASRPQKGEEVP
ncbi:hypothetical protein [Bradyrhizobium sp. AZCC 2289]|uniref:hypothetical protein n=1 Tax=Bradyrhizobium sp. AZCC 2289 TaxID=3117026 RepID=UPI002FF12EA3